MKRSTFLLAACMAVAAPAVLAQGPAYPNKPVKIVVGYPPGGASDIVARLVAQELQAMNNQGFVVENRPGVGGMLGMSVVAKSPADGYTLGLGVSGTLTTGPHLTKTRLYDPLKDFEPITMVAKAPMILLASPAFKYDNVNALVREAKARPGELMFASGAQAFELALQLFKSKADVNITSVSYPGGAQASIDVMSGRVPLMVDTIGAQQENIRTGKLKPLAVLDSKRSPLFPDVPTMAEAGVNGYEALGWTSLVAPPGTPEAIVQKLNQQVGQVLAKPEVKKRLLQLGFEPWHSTPQQAGKIVASEYAKWGDVVRTSGMQAQ
ncbi:Bug family tripartite tricarboxylate transporter substrate binding protein [Ramlibacter humi]|uniref:Bug family tripartite tricarboxylate transporter substrate binding protein n=1 Tax=Ramlibacter humi TaxID=2530451 RepID=UPI0014316A09|nr:tripartite tricarboxylate transporter substrate binding protein [Ramlibacter humi]